MLCGSFVRGQVLITEVMGTPTGPDKDKEFVGLLATTSVDFSITPYTLVVLNNGAPSDSGWNQGAGISYAFELNSGSVSPGEVFYIGGDGTAVPGACMFYTIKYSNTAGDGFGNSSTASDGIIGDGGDLDGVALFNVAAANIYAHTPPVDAIFYGDNATNVVLSGGAIGYTLPNNDLYTGGYLDSSSYYSSGLENNKSLQASGMYDTSAGEFVGVRTWTSASYAGACPASSGISLIPDVDPTIVISGNNSQYLHLNQVTTSYVSGVIDDPIDPAATFGINFRLYDANTTASSITVTASSSDASVVPNNAANLVLTGTDTLRNLKIIPTGKGFTTITVTANDGSNSSDFTIEFASSELVTGGYDIAYHTGMSDASAAIMLDDDHMLVSDDETNYLRVYDIDQSGYHLNEFYYGGSLDLTDETQGVPDEIDLESVAPSPTISGRTYWMGSHGNSNSGNTKVNRRRLFATDHSGTAPDISMSVVGYYDLLSDILAWGDSHGYQLTSNYSGSAQQLGTVNIETIAFAPDSTTLYIGFRAPYVPVSSRDSALIAPIENFETWFNNGSPSGSPTIGDPIVLDLKMHGFREIYRTDSNNYLIVGGSYDGTDTFNLFTWTGDPNDQPVMTSAQISAYNFEGIIGVNNPVLSDTTPVTLLADNGSFKWYDNQESKALANDEHQKFMSIIMQVNGDTVPNTLPVGWLDFQGKMIEGMADLRWRTATEINNSHFIVQRTIDGLNWVNIGEVPGSGNSSEIIQYRFTDLQPSHGVNYYRLKQVDFDNTTDYSKIIQLSFNSETKGAELYPNPVHSQLQIQASKGHQIDVIEIYDATGVLVMYSSNTGNKTQLNVSLEGLPAGIYIIKLLDSNSREIHHDRLLKY